MSSHEKQMFLPPRWNCRSAADFSGRWRYPRSRSREQQRGLVVHICKYTGGGAEIPAA